MKELKNVNLSYINARLSKELTATLRFEIDEYFNSKLYLKPPKLLYHYTNLESFSKIVSNHTILLSHIAYLNDASELNYGFNVIYETIKSISSEFEKDFGDLLNIVLDTIINNFEFVSDAFVFSLSEEDNKLSQWRAYGNNNGIAIGFETNDLSMLTIKGLETDNKIKIQKCVYNNTDQRELILGLFNIISSYRDKVVFDINAKPEGTTLHYELSNAITKFAPCLKHYSFEEEKEWRLVKILSFNSEEHLKCVGYRSSNSMLIPNIFIENKNTILPIKNINIGPNPHPHLNEKSINHILRKMNYLTVGIRNCGIPYRVN